MKTTKPPRRPDAASHGRGPSLLRVRLGESLQQHRVAAGLTQLQLATRAGLSLKYVGEIERGEANTTIDVLERLGTAANWDAMHAFDGFREPVSEGVRVLLVQKLRGYNQGFQEAIQWLEALAPARNRPAPPSSKTGSGAGSS